MRRRARLVGLIAGVALLAAPPAAGAQQPLPSETEILFSGGGWGHGHGMGQWGARGQAEAGRSWQQILKTYYSGISFDDRGNETIRVLVHSGGSIRVGGEYGYTIKWADGTTIAPEDPAQPYVRVSATSSGVLIEKGPARSGPWTTIASGNGIVRFHPTQSLMAVHRSSEIRYYRGVIEANRRGPSLLYGINQLGMNQYLYGVVPREMPASWPAAAVRAQSIAARTYAAFKKVASSGVYHICSSTACQVYGGWGYRTSPSAAVTKLEHPASNDAVLATSGTVMTVAGAPIFSEFHSSSGGHTSAGSKPYLAPVADPWDEGSPHHRWTGKVTVAEIEQHWPAVGRLIDIADVQRDGHGPWGGRVTSMVLHGTSSDVTVSGTAFRSAFPWSSSRPSGIKSTLFNPVVPVQSSPISPGLWVLGGNMIENPSMETGTSGAPPGWQQSVGSGDGRATDAAYDGVASLKLTGDPDVRTTFVQHLNLPGAAGDRYVLSGWNRTAGSSSTGGPIAVTVKLRFTDGTFDAHQAIFPAEPHEWIHREISFAAAKEYRRVDVYAEYWRQSGTGWFDRLHLTRTRTENHTFETSASSADGWRLADSSDGVTSATAVSGTSSLHFNGSPSKNAYAVQPVTVPGGRGERFRLSAWNRTIGSDPRRGVISVYAAVRHKDGTRATHAVVFPKQPHDWSYGQLTFVTRKAYQRIDVFARFSYQTGEAWFDDIRLAPVGSLSSNAGFEAGGSVPDDWRMSHSGDGRAPVIRFAGSASLRFDGALKKNAHAVQRISMAGGRGEVFRLSAWNRTRKSTAGRGVVAVYAAVRHTDGSSAFHAIRFPKGPHNWIQGEVTFVTTKPFSRIDLVPRFAYQTGRAWFDEVRLAPMGTLSANPGFEAGDTLPADWRISHAGDGRTTEVKLAGSASLQLDGAKGKNAHGLQRLPLAGSAGDRFLFSGWNRAAGSTPRTGIVKVQIVVRHTDGTLARSEIQFPMGPHSWRYREVRFQTTKPYRRIDIVPRFAYQTGRAWFDELRLVSLD